MIKSVILF